MTARAAALALLAGLAACERHAEGERRPIVRTWGGETGIERVRGEEVWRDGRWVRDGGFRFFDREGRERARGSFVLGLESGPWVETYDDGGSGSGEYRAGKRSGEWTYWTEEGRVQQQGAYEDGERSGRWIEWYEDGVTLRSEVSWERGKKSGAAVYRNRDGTVNAQLSGTYREGVKVD